MQNLEHPTMRLPYPRFTVRRLMVAVAIIAVLLGGLVWVDAMSRRSAEFAKKADQSRQAQTIRLDQMNGCISPVKAFDAVLGATRAVNPEDREEIEHFLQLRGDHTTKAEGFRKKAEYWAARREKYFRASRRPWLPVAPDSPEP